MYLYHGIVKENFQEILDEGVNPYSYWGTIEEASLYTDCNKIIRIEAEYYSLSPNTTLADHYEESDDEEEYELFQEWVNSSQSWRDSLRIFGSVVVDDRVIISEEHDVISI